jgi:phage terminase small subunit
MAVKKNNTELNDQQNQFTLEYIVDFNGKQAAIRAGYSKRSAEVTASRLLSNDKVSSRIKELVSQRAERTQITADYVLFGLKEVAERCMQHQPVMVFDYQAKKMAQRTDDDGKAVWEFDSSGANKAFELLGKHVGIFERDNNQKNMKITISAKK